MANTLRDRKVPAEGARVKRIDGHRPQDYAEARTGAACSEKAPPLSAGVFRILHPLSNTVKMLAVLATRLPGAPATNAARVCAVAGYLGSEAQWERFAPHWESVLSGAGLKAFDTADYERGKGEFAGWTADQKTGLLERLVDAINESGFEAIGSALPLAEFEALSSADRVSLTRGRPGDPHLLCFNHCLVEAAQRAAPLPREEKVCFVFDWHDEIGSAGLWHFEELKNLTSEPVRERLGALGFESRKEFSPLQAAELLAYECSHHTEDDYRQRLFPVH